MPNLYVWIWDLIWRRPPSAGVLVYSDKWCQYTSYEWRNMLKENGLKASMCRRGNCHGNACAKSFFSLLKKERIRRRTYPTRETAKSYVFNYIELFYNPTRRHGNNEITVTCHPWSLKITILGTKQVSREMGAYHYAKQATEN
jgi:transposase InsO family protein